MNILYLVNHLNIGGITSYVFSLSKALKARDHNIFVASGSGELLSEFKDAGFTHILVPMRTKSELSPGILVSLFKLKKIVKRHGIQIIHSNSRTTQVLGVGLSFVTGVPHVTTAHGFFRKSLSRRIFSSWGKNIIAISDSVKDHLVSDFGRRDCDISVIYNGIDTDRFLRKDKSSVSGLKEELRIAATAPVIGIIARLSDVKGHCYLLEAMKDVLAQIPQAKLLIVGEGRMYGQLLALTKKLGIENNVVFMRQVCDTSRVLSVMDVFVMPSLQEGLGLALMEAMAAGVPAVGSAVGGIKDLIQDGFNGFLVSPADPGALSKAILRLLREPDKAKSLAQQARVFINESFSLKKMALETEEFYQKCADQK